MYSFIITVIDKATNAPTPDRRYKRRKCFGYRRKGHEPSSIFFYLLTESCIIDGDIKYAFADRRDRRTLEDFSDHELLLLGITTKKKERRGEYYIKEC